MLSALVGPLTVRAGVETGPAVVAAIGKGTSAGYGAVGEVVGAAAALQSVARPASVLVGPVTHAATSGLFEWGPTRQWPLLRKPSLSWLATSSVPRPAPRARPVGANLPNRPL